jgi:hypothetical protein
MNSLWITLAHFCQTILSMLLLSGNTLNDFGILLLSMTGSELFSIRSKNKKNYLNTIYFKFKVI